LGRLRGPEVFARIEAMTSDAMNGKIPVESVFGKRLEIIKPSRDDVEELGRRYVAQIEPTAVRTVAALKKRDWLPVIVSGGFAEAIRPLADVLGIERVEAVRLFFDENGAYRGFDQDFPTTRSGGKPEVVRRLRSECGPETVVMVGDGASDLESRPAVDLFVGFGRYTVRPKVRAEAGAFIKSLAELLELPFLA
jgi:phosphoserine phosphatase